MNATTTSGRSLIITVQINSKTDFMGGDITFGEPQKGSEDTISLLQGDMLIHHGKQPRSNGGVTGGEKVVLVMLVDLEF